MEKRIVYADNNATTRVAPEVFEAMRPFLTDLYGNPSSIHSFGGQVARHVQAARESVASLLGARSSEILFTSCGTEGDNAAILNALKCRPGRRKVVASRVEHSAILNMRAEIESMLCKFVEAPVDAQGRLRMDELEKLLDEDTAVLSVMWANNETGNIYPVERLAAMAHAVGALFHTDAVQAVGKIPISMADSAIDTLSLSGHKLHAPKGVGALYIRSGLKFHPFLIGGHQESGRRGGTENVPGIVGLGRAASLAAERMDDELTRVKALRDTLESEILSRIPSARINGDPSNRLPNTTNIGFEAVEGEAILLLLDREGICASSGSACTTGSLEPSHVLRAMDVPKTFAHGSVRLSLSVYNSEADVARIVEALPPIIAQLREMSPYWRK